MKRMSIWIAIAAIAGCKSEPVPSKAETATPNTATPKAEPPSVAKPTSDTEAIAATLTEDKPVATPVARPTADQAAALATQWLAAIRAGKVDGVTALMADRVRISHEAYPSAVACPTPVVVAASPSELAVAATCAIDVLGDGVERLVKRVTAKTVSETPPSDWMDPVSVEDSYSYVSVSSTRTGEVHAAVVVVATTADGPRVVAAHVHRELMDD